MPHDADTGKPCYFQIPQSPGKHRSPEEYDYAHLDDKLDIYSVANVLFSILTGEEAWEAYSTRETQKMVKKGIKPYIPDEFRPPGSTDEALGNLIELAYEVDPSKRISAAELVTELEALEAKLKVPT